MKEIMQTYGAMIVAVVVGIALLSGFGALKNKMSVAFAPQDILSSDSAMTVQAAYQPMARQLAFRIMVCMICMSG